MVFTVGMPDRKDIYASVDDFKPTDVCTAPNGDFYVFDGLRQAVDPPVH